MSTGKAWINPFLDYGFDPEETVNTLTHGIGLLLSLVAAGVLLNSVVQQPGTARQLACATYAFSLVGVYLMSTLSHCCLIPDKRRWFRILDQAFIYLLIVSTYTPFSVTYLPTFFWSSFLTVMWAVAVSGFLSKTFFAHGINSVSIWMYVALGWMPIFSAGPMIAVVPTPSLLGILLGGLCYTVGAVFLALDKRVRHFHAVWHLMVIAGSAFHYFAIMRAVVGTQ